MSIRPKIRGKVSVRKPSVDMIIRTTRFTTAREVETFLEQILVKVLRDTIKEIIIWIGLPKSARGHVPRATGQLRANLIDNLRSSSVDRARFLKLVLGSNLEYAQYVNTTGKQFKHFGEVGYARRFGARGKIRLDDPDAVSEFFEELKKFAGRRLRSNLVTELTRRLGTAGIPPQPFTSGLDVVTP